MLVQGAARVAIEKFIRHRALPGRAAFRRRGTSFEPSVEIKALLRNVQAHVLADLEELPKLPEELLVAVANVDDAAGSPT